MKWIYYMLVTSLQQRIIDRIQSQGPLPFADYMRMSLYEPEHGYYVNEASKVGWEGDFYTSTNVSDFFAHCMGRQLLHMSEQLERPTPFIVLEQGAGRGDLARGVQNWAAQEAPAFLNALDYHAEDICTGHDALQSSQERSDSLRPHVILSNELVDAFPVHIVEKRDDKLYEVYVTLDDGVLKEVLDEPGSPQIASYLDTYNIPWKTFADGWRAEINLDALRWMQRTARLLTSGASSPSTHKRGFLLTVDYGDEARALYTPERRRGTLACYYRHRMTERPLTRPGEQDMTAHVNFTALMQEGEKQGLHRESFTTQEQWLKEMGIQDELTLIRNRDYAILDTDKGSDRGQVALFQWYNLRQQVSALTDPNGMGNFKVLILSA